MTHNTTSSYKAVGGVFLFKALRTLPLIFFILSIFLAVACEKEATRYPEMAEYHAESVNLPSATTDSVSRFSQKFKAFVTNHPAAMGDPLYPKIVYNIKQQMKQEPVPVFVLSSIS